MATDANARERRARDFLDRLELAEARLLTWGVVDGAFTREELDEHEYAFLSGLSEAVPQGELVNDLLDRRLLFEVGGVFRTRMAESVRLFARMRQLFPDRDWQVAPTLVADYRFMVRPRLYPRRHIPPDAVADGLAAELGTLSTLQREALGAMLGAGTPGELELADFQLGATARMLADLGTGQSRGMIVTVGTGSGKTLAFYLPALTRVASQVERRQAWTQAIALYPRNELLKDQFTETYRTARRLDAALKAAGKRKIRIGAFFGLTPSSTFDDAVKRAGWTPQGRDYICPFLRCPVCDGALGWYEGDMRKDIERLQCTERRCSGAVEADEVPLTRKSMEQTPPDLLFTTTEMLNRLLGDSQYGKLVGVGAARAPEMMLLDEVHTYGGVHGAQVAMLLRRWHHAVGRPPIQFTGLSATLRHAPTFFASLTGLGEHQVVEIAPREEDMVQEGMEYQLLLRGDPVSATSLLSTSIQAAMLLRRVLDVHGGRRTGGLYGERLFVFTDDLDVTNRLYHSLLDAEGLDEGGRRKPRRVPLAALRESTGTDAAQRLPAGQSWKVPEQIGHTLREPLRVERTSSQDPGVERDADIIVTTPSLEVGYSDPAVGAVMQHKAPRDIASFLQRKGRAGRVRAMRPWTVVVLSDYGRDRIAYQGYELLFNPVLEPHTLPVRNRYVLRIQAAFAFMDWMSGKLPAGLPAGSLWRDFATPHRADDSRDKNRIPRHQRETEILARLMSGAEPALEAELLKYVAGALRIPHEEAEALFWEPPRALMTAVLPTLLRRLEANWDAVADGSARQTDAYVRDHPLPEFVPKTLFSDLNLPEVSVVIPGRRRTDSPSDHAMPVIQAIREFAPGRATRRFAVQDADISHWVAPVRLDTREQDLPFQDFCTEFEDLGEVQAEGPDGAVQTLRCVRPWKLRTTNVPKNIASTSNAFPEWRSQLAPADEGVVVEVPRTPLWSGLVHEIAFFTQVHNSAVRVRRFSLGSSATVKLRVGTSHDTAVRFTDGETGLPAAVGFSQEVDGIRFRVRLPSGWRVAPDASPAETVRAFRTAYFRHRVMTDPVLGQHANSFQREWLAQIYLSALTATAAKNNLHLSEAQGLVVSKGLGRAAERVLKVIFRSLDVEEFPADDDAAEAEGEEEARESARDRKRQRVEKELAALFTRPDVGQALAENAAVLWNAPDEGWDAWARERLLSTIGAAFLEGCRQLYPEAAAGDLYLDLGSGPPAPGTEVPVSDVHEIWITETTGGGGGVVEELLRRYASDPRRFFHLVEGALSPSDFELIDSELTRLLEWTETEVGVRDALASVRQPQGHQDLLDAVHHLRDMLSERGLMVTHAVMSGITARVLRPASSPETDALLRDLLREWHRLEHILGIDIDARVFAYVLSLEPAWGKRITHVSAAQQSDGTWVFQTFYGLLWPRGNLVRSRALSPYNPFAGQPPTDRTFLLDLLRDEEPWVEVSDPAWRERLTEALAGYGSARLVAVPDQRALLKACTLEVAAAPVDVGFLQLYPRVHAVRREPERLSVRVHLREVVP